MRLRSAVSVLVLTAGMLSSSAAAAERLAPDSLATRWAAQSDQAGAILGYSVASAGDVNGDGFDDVIVGARSYSNGQGDEGRALVYYGSADGPSVAPDWTAESDQTDAEFGTSVASAGDVNGDGFDDVIVGADAYDNGQFNEGRAYVYLGSGAGLSVTPDWTAESDQVGVYFGYSVASAGDVNGDGYGDVIVGAPYYGNGQTTEGRAFVYHGSSAGLSVTPDWTAESNQDYALFGNSVASAGDVNGDGYGDVIVGAVGYDNGQEDEGRAYAYQGSVAGLSMTPDWTAESNQVAALFGNSVASAGDVNGDGYSDLIVGAYAYDNGETDEGRAFVFEGSAAGLSTSPDWIAQSNRTVAYFGFSVASAGNVNGDGYGDVIVGAPQYTNGKFEGKAFAYYGSAAGLSTTPDWTVEPNQIADDFAFSVASAGDVNGDGYGDLIVGAPFYDHGQIDEGAAFLYTGSAKGPRR
jgi:hypothetical protein